MIIYEKQKSNIQQENIPSTSRQDIEIQQTDQTECYSSESEEYSEEEEEEEEPITINERETQTNKQQIKFYGKQDIDQNINQQTDTQQTHEDQTKTQTHKNQSETQQNIHNQQKNKITQTIEKNKPMMTKIQTIPRELKVIMQDIKQLPILTKDVSRSKRKQSYKEESSDEEDDKICRFKSEKRRKHRNKQKIGRPTKTLDQESAAAEPSPDQVDSSHNESKHSPCDDEGGMQPVACCSRSKDPC